MATHNGTHSGTDGIANEKVTSNMSHEEHETAKAAARFGYGPLAAAAPGQIIPGGHPRTLANPAPLGLSAFALTTFVLSLINLQTRGIAGPNLVVGIAFGYGGLVQLLAGMWAMAAGNTFAATALSSYGGFWISFAIILTPGGFEIVSSLGGETSSSFLDSFGLYLIGWFIFTLLLLMATLRTHLAFFLLFFTLDMTFLLLGIGYLHRDADGAPHQPSISAGGVFGVLAAFLAWYNALYDIYADNPHATFFQLPVLHFPWSKRSLDRRGKVSQA